MISKSNQTALNVFPQAYCLSCEEKTPHRHERLAIHGTQMARATCLTCNNERTGFEEGKRLANPS